MSEDVKWTMYAVVRSDIPLPAQTVQLCHACIEAGVNFKVYQNCNLVCLTVDTEVKLIALHEKVEAYDIACAEFRESEWPIGFNAFCTMPICRKIQKAVFADLPLFGG